MPDTPFRVPFTQALTLVCEVLQFAEKTFKDEADTYPVDQDLYYKIECFVTYEEYNEPGFVLFRERSDVAGNHYEADLQAGFFLSDMKSFTDTKAAFQDWLKNHIVQKMKDYYNTQKQEDHLDDLKAIHAVAQQTPKAALEYAKMVIASEKSGQPIAFD